MRMIDADAVMEQIKNCPSYKDYEWSMYADEFVEMLDFAPTIEERKTGRWILHENQRQEDVDNGNYLYICSECGKSDIHAKTQEVPFCWWCGAKMEVEHE